MKTLEAFTSLVINVFFFAFTESYFALQNKTSTDDSRNKSFRNNEMPACLFRIIHAKLLFARKFHSDSRSYAVSLQLAEPSEKL